jgi:L-alanine-DL-glutamate epimerase-like enolase superfamily enzyme
MHVQTIEIAVVLAGVVEAHARQCHAHHGGRVGTHVAAEECSSTWFIVILDNYRLNKQNWMQKVVKNIK